MRRSRVLRSMAMAVATAMAVAGCGLTGDPVVSTEEEVLDALMGVHDSAQVRATVALEFDEDEVRDVLRDDAEARALFREAVDGDGGEEVDALLADLEEARTALADHAVLLATGSDGSARVAAEYKSVVWADLRMRVDADLDRDDQDDRDDPATGRQFDLQLQIDWATAAQVFDQPDLLGDLDEAAAEIVPFLGDMPTLEPVQELLLAFLGGELVGIGGELTPEMLAGLGLPGRELSAEELSGATDPGATEPGSAMGFDALELDPREFAGTAFTFDSYRRDADSTLVDVTVEVREAAELALDQLADAPDAAGMSADHVAELRAKLDELPDQLVDVATLRLDEAGTLQQVRVDLLDAALQLGRAAEPDDEDLATVERVAGQLDASGLFAVLDVEGVGQTGTVLGDPSTTVTPEQLTAAFGALLFQRLGAFDPGALDRGLEGPAAGSDG